MEESIRIDKWLWAARFYKTRALATEAVTGGKVHLNGQRIKPSKAVSAGDVLEINKGGVEFVVDVLDVAEKRRSAPLAQTMYAETEDSIEKREKVREMQRLASQGVHHGDRKPSKKQRSQIIRFKRKQ